MTAKISFGGRSPSARIDSYRWLKKSCRSFGSFEHCLHIVRLGLNMDIQTDDDLGLSLSQSGLKHFTFSQPSSEAESAVSNSPSFFWLF